MKRVLLICALSAYLSSALVAEEADSKPADKLVQNPAAPVSIEPINVTSPKGFILEDATPMRLRFNRTISSADAHVGDTVDFEVLQDISVNGTLVIPKGGLAFGTVTEAQQAKN